MTEVDPATVAEVEKEKLGEAPVTKTKMYDAEGRPLLMERSGGEGRSTTGPNTRILSIEDVTEEEEAKEERKSRKSSKDKDKDEN